MSKLGIVLIIIGLVMMGAGYFSPAISEKMGAVISVSASSNPLTWVSGIPSSTSSSSPSPILKSDTLTATFSTPVAMPYTIAPTISGASGSLSVSGAAVSVTVSTADYEITTSPATYAAKIVLSASFAPSSTQYGQSLSFAWTATFSANGELVGQTSSSTMLYGGSSTLYGEYAQSLSGLGEFGVSAPGYAFQYLTSSSDIKMSFSSFPQTLTFYYVENNGATVGASEIYITVNGVSYVMWAQSTNGPSTTVNGYTAYDAYFNAQPGQYTINGYVVNASSDKGAQLMSLFTYIPSNNGTISPPLSQAQWDVIIVGGIITIIGVVATFRKILPI